MREGKGQAELLDILTPSPRRVTPPCPHYAACGGCALQHWDMAAYSDWKREVVIAHLRRAGLEGEVAPIFTVPPHSRRRVGLHARKTGKSVLLGFKARRSWTLVPIETCADKHESYHFANLTDLQLKYADVEPVRTVFDWLEARPDA